MTEVKKFLIEVKNLIIDSNNWTQGSSAKANGKPCYLDDFNANCFCLLGVIGRIDVDMAIKNKASDAIRITIAKVIGEPITNKNISISNFNDTHSHEEVIKIIDDTIVNYN